MKRKKCDDELERKTVTNKKETQEENDAFDYHFNSCHFMSLHQSRQFQKPTHRYRDDINDIIRVKCKIADEEEILRRVQQNVAKMHTAKTEKREKNTRKKDAKLFHCEIGKCPNELNS